MVSGSWFPELSTQFKPHSIERLFKNFDRFLEFAFKNRTSEITKRNVFLVVINKIWDDKYIKNTTKILTLLKMITIKSLKLNVKKLFSKMSI